MRSYSFLDQLCLNIDSALKTLAPSKHIPSRPNPATKISQPELSNAEQKQSAALMRVNHVGEVCAQALYQGQALTAKLPNVREQMQQAAHEEQDHLAWCAQRIDELGGHTSFLNPLWYSGAFAIGAVAGVVGDRWSLGFVAETEKQVVEHLHSHLEKLSPHDLKTRVILEKMAEEEAHHATQASTAGGATLPQPVKQLMRLSAKVMTTTAYYV